MKPNLPLLFLCIVLLLLTQVHAQISVPAARFTQPGWTLYEAFDDQFVQFHNGFTGGNQTFNFSTLRPVNIDTLQLITPAQAPFGQRLPGNLVLLRNGGLSGTQYFQIDTASWKMNGYVDATGFPIANLGTRTLVQFPIATNQAFGSTYRNDIVFYVGQDLMTGFIVDSIHRRTHFAETSQVVGWGNLTTPLGTYPVLVQALSSRSADTADFKRADNGQWLPAFETHQQHQVTYLFWSDAYAWPLAELTDPDSTGLIEFAQWITGGTATSVKPHEPLALHVWPNPASDWLYIQELEDHTTYTLYDLAGKAVASGQLLPHERNAISLLEQTAGPYLLVLEAGNRRHFAKLTIQK